MTTSTNRHRSVRVGLHTNAATFDNVPGTTNPIQLTGDNEDLLPRERESIVRPHNTQDGRRLPSVWGRQNIGEISLPFEATGVNDNDGAAVADWLPKMSWGRILTSFFGAAPAATSGAATTASGTAGATLTVASGTNIPNGQWILFTTTTGTFIRKVTSGGTTNTLTLDRAASGTASGTVFRLPAWAVNTSLTEHIHLFVESELKYGMGRFFGCAPQTMSLELPDTGLVTANFGFMPTTTGKENAPGGAYAAPTEGAHIAVDGYRFFIGATEFLLQSASLSVSNGVIQRATGSRANGVLGGLAADKSEIALSGSIAIRTNSDLAELRDAAGTPSVRDLAGQTNAAAGEDKTTRDLLLHLGAPGRALAIRLPAADLVGSESVVNGIHCFSFEAHATGAAPLEVVVG